ncbi:PREDICTED: ferredoxin-thioredoxin reductase, variable chain-like [Populus euphratica]|uniref:Ferredoxin-thioredoxin reductase, variable chain-like n=1 Tax=Populus euphratica TaxID=75702 RepID=A0AAJ6UPX1_POPEU|nr:PREDICTED: ferredoxin-thioredoxin reductase, variable chain-like [Populus euphratica]XP_011033106.1 PREDICTED: ferredoxin-thioredoxin reductase, variable chain-like [Populus euphratica]XP_011033107.1 PREDICTED: ferredoxin-thioredoxin reductase, variable chain-like [Populus euphratica]
MSTSLALSSAATTAVSSAFPATDTNKFKFNALISPNPRLNCRYSIITPTATSIATSSSSRRRRKTAVSCSVVLGSNNSATMVTDDDEEEEAKKKIGARVRVKAPVKAYHVPRVAKEVDLCGLEGEVKQYVSQWKGKQVSANLPYKTQFVHSGGVKFFAHLRGDELEFID